MSAHGRDAEFAPAGNSGCGLRNPSDIRRTGCQMYAAGPCLLLALDRLGRNAPGSALEAAMLDLSICPEAGCSSPAERLISLHPVDVRDVAADALPSPHCD